MKNLPLHGNLITFSILTLTTLGVVSCGQMEGDGAVDNSSTNNSEFVELNSSEKAYTFLNSTPDLAAQVSVPTLDEQIAIDNFDASRFASTGKRLVEGFNIAANPVTAGAALKSISFSEGGISTPYLVCYYNFVNPTTKTTQLVWFWALNNPYYYKGWFSSYWTYSSYYNLKRADGKELRYASLAYVSDKTDASLKSACEKSKVYWAQGRSSWAYQDQLNPFLSQIPSNSTFAYYAEAKSSLGYSRHLFATDAAKQPRTKFTSMVVFGDSLSDTGNLFLRTAQKVPRTDYYYRGTFSNKFNWVSDVQFTLNLPVYNSAYASAETNNTVNYGLPLSVLKAIEEYNQHAGVWNSFYYGGYVGQASYGAGDPATTLFSVYAGGNNYLDYVIDNNTYPAGVKFNNPKSTGTYLGTEDFTTQTVADLEKAIHDLIAVGGRYFLTASLPDLGIVPQVKYSGFATPISEAIKAHNEKLYAKIKEMAALNPTVSFIYMDLGAIIQETLDNPAPYHFSVLDKPCYTGKYFYLPSDPAPTTCSNPNAYVFWDSVHPTARAHGFIAYLLNNYLYANFKK